MDAAALIQSIYAAFGRGDLPYLLAQLTDDVEWAVADNPAIPWAGTRRGRAGAQQFFEVLLSSAEVTAFEPRQFVAQGDTVVVLGRETIRIRATGKSYTTEWAHAWKVRGDKASHFREHFDSAAAARALTR